jgi:HAD superfamily hydrolase (TIGR01509 family)
VTYNKKLENIKALILDMDGVLVDTEPLHMKAFELFLNEYDIETNKKFLQNFIGYSIEDNIKMLFSDYPVFKDLNMQDAINYRNDIYLSLIKKQQLASIEGIKELIDFCLAHKIKLGLASSSDKTQVDTILTNISSNPSYGIDLYATLSAIVSGDMVARKKPWPDVYLKALKQLKVDARYALAIEDSQVGIKSAKSAGMFCAALKNPYTDVEQMNGYDWILNNITEQVDLFKQARP